jgi:hypothetical protein
MSHVTSFRFRAGPGQRRAVIDSFEHWGESERRR